MKIIEDLRNVMDEFRLSPEQAAKFIGCSGKQVRRWLEDEYIPSLMSRNAILNGIKKIKKAFRDEDFERAIRDRDLYRKLKKKISFEEKDQLLDCAYDYSIYRKKLYELAKKYQIDIPK